MIFEIILVKKLFAWFISPIHMAFDYPLFLNSYCIRFNNKIKDTYFELYGYMGP